MRKAKERNTFSSSVKFRQNVLLCLLLTIVLFVFAGGFALFERRQARAETLTTSFFGVNTASIATPAEGVQIDRVGTGSDDRYRSYEGTINGKFQMNEPTKIEFTFPKDADASMRQYFNNFQFDFRIEDVSGTGAYVIVKYYFGLHGPASGRVAVIHVDENGNQQFRSSSADGTKFVTSKDDVFSLTTGCLPYVYDANKNVGFMNLSWEGDVLTVSAPLYDYKSITSNTNNIADAKEATVAKFGESFYGLPAVSFPNGYKISFVADGYQSVIFTSIAGTSLAGSIDVDPAWHTAASNVSNIIVSDTVEKVYPINTPVTFPAATYYTGAGMAGAAEIYITAPGGSPTQVTGETTLATAGTYTLQYKDGTSNVGGVKTFTFEVNDTPFTAIGDFIGLTTPDTATISQMQMQRYGGMQILASDAYAGEVKGVFGSNENAKVEFLFPEVKNLAADALSFVFKIADAEDPTKYFEIEYYYSMSAQYKHTNAIVRYVDDAGVTQYRYASHAKVSPAQIYTQKDVESSKANATAVLPQVANQATSGYFSLVWEGDVLSVKVPTVLSNVNETSQETLTTIAKFDGTTAVDAAAGTFGLPKISFAKGYKISFSSGNKQTIMFTAINGADLSKAFHVTLPAWHQEYRNTVFIETDTPVWGSYPTNTVVTIPSATYAHLGANDTVAKIELKKDGGEYQAVNAGAYTFTEAGAYTLRYTAKADYDGIGNKKEYSFLVQKDTEFPVYVHGGGTAYAVYPVNYPIEILGAQYSFIDDTLVDMAKIELKKDNGAFEITATGDRTFTEPGVYTLRYTAIEGGVYLDNVTEFTFEVKAENEFAVTIVGGGTEYAVYPANYSFEILGATYYYVPDAFFDVGKIEIKLDDGEYETISAGYTKFSEAGIYTLRYTAINGGSYLNNQTEFTFEIKEQAEFSLDIAVDGIYEEDYPAYYDFTIFGGTYSLITDEVVEVDRIEISKNGGTYVPIAEGSVFFDVLGVYKIRYTAVANGGYQGNTKTFTIEITNDTIVDSGELKQIFTGESLEVDDYQVTLRDGAKLDGLLVGASSGSAATPYTGAIAGSFAQKKDATIEMIFPDISGIETTNFGITFKVEDVNDPTNYFEIVYYYVSDSTLRCKTRVAVRYGDQFRTANWTNSTLNGIYASKAEVETAETVKAAIPDVKYSEAKGYFTIAWENDVVVVKASTLTASGFNYAGTTDAIIAKFDGTGAIDVATKSFGLPKMAFPNGYKISFTSTSAQPIMFTSLCGLKFNKDVTGSAFRATSISVLNPSISYEATAGSVNAKNIPNAGAKINYNLTSGAYTFKGEKIIYPDVSDVDFTTPGDYNVTYSARGVAKKTQTLTIVDTPPILSFAQGVYQTETYNKGGTHASSLIISKADVSHIVDKVDGVIAPDGIEVFIKGPSDADYTAYSFGEFQPQAMGTYLIKYVVKDKNGLEGAIVRTINVVDGEIPVITLESELANPETVLIKQTITLPVGSAVSQGAAVDLIRSVYYEDVELTIANNQLTFDKAGTYIVSYYAKDSADKEALLRFVYKIVEDTTAPVITVGEMSEYVLIGKKVELAQYAATDAVDGLCTVSVKVMYGTTVVEVSNNKFTAKDLGVYSIIFTSFDEAGNKEEKIVTVAAVKTIPTDGDGDGVVDSTPEESGCGSDNIGLFVGLGIFLVAGLLVGGIIAIVRHKRKTSKKDDE